MQQKIGFVGVGRMGSAMARRLAECGFGIAAVYDVNTVAAQALGRELGVPVVGELGFVLRLLIVGVGATTLKG